MSAFSSIAAARVENFNGSATLTEAEALRAPDLSIGSSHVRLEGLQYRIHLDLRGRDDRPLTGDLSIAASPGRVLPPLQIMGARGWRTGYVVPVMSGRLDGELNVAGERLSLDGGIGYHDHNWGFWEGVSWQWGQVQHDDVSFIYGRIFPPPAAADRERMPGFVGATRAGRPPGLRDERHDHRNERPRRPAAPHRRPRPRRRPRVAVPI